jgi:tight adherence protein C
MDAWTIGVFVLVLAGTLAAAVGGPRRRVRALDRLAPRMAERTPATVSPALVWRWLVQRVGTTVPAAAKDLPQLKRRLVRAGLRDPSAARLFQGGRAGLTAAFALGGLAVAWKTGMNVLLAPALAMAGYMAPGHYLLWRISRRQYAVGKGLPNALDLMVVCVESGLGIDQALIQVAKELHHAHPEICDEFAVMNLELRAGKRRAEALHNLAERTGVEDLKKLVAVLVQTDRFGTSIAQSLRGHADYLRTLARQRAEEKASKLAVKLVFPIFFCVLPSLFVVTVGPVLTKLIRDLFPMIENM